MGLLPDSHFAAAMASLITVIVLGGVAALKILVALNGAAQYLVFGFTRSVFCFIAIRFTTLSGHAVETRCWPTYETSSIVESAAAMIVPAAPPARRLC